MLQLMISQHRQLQDKDESYISNDNAFQGNPQLTENLRTLDQEQNTEAKGLDEGYKFDKPTDLDPDSDLAFLFNGMSIDEHGKIYQPIGRHIKDKTKAIADNLDYHPAPPSQGTIIHEMLHAIGSWHEMARKDRNNYMTVDMDNVIKGAGSNFYVRQTSDITPFDPASDVMYGVYSFSKNGDKTEFFHDWRQEFLAGTGKTLSFYDIADVTAAYGCTDSCVSPPTCQHGGFIDQTCSCACPPDLTGTVCQQLDQSSSNCGGTVNIAGGETYFLTSPNYPSNYDTGLKCVWFIQGDPGNHIRATVTDMDISYSKNTCYHWIEIVYYLLANKGPEYVM
ncbi:Hypothetical predicted protein [Mytilus galloprovincialis]|uniref:Metalloendopeptidase n=1 Tax=Mytilus galloprovincialis TaxID=29158 RepID=A0A8B6BWP4_MYTGA|nr:Hypothetical predicted protein [Mytilus galloprovincialis]